MFVGCLTSQQHASVSQRRICSDNFTCCHTEKEVADPTFYLTQSQYTDTGPTSPSADPIKPGSWQCSQWSANFEVTGMTRPGKIPSQAGFKPRIFHGGGENDNDDDGDSDNVDDDVDHVGGGLVLVRVMVIVTLVAVMIIMMMMMMMMSSSRG